MALLNYEQAAEFLGVKVGTLYSLVCRKQIPHVRFNGRNVKFRKEELDQWIEEKSVPAEQTERCAQ